MAEKENREDPQVNLEMPSIGFGRKKKRGESPAPDIEPAASDPEPAAPAPAPAERETSPSTASETRPLFVDDVDPVAASPADPEPIAETDAADETAPEPKPRREPGPPPITGMPAAMVTGLVVGALTVGLTWLGLRGCEAIEGTESCGGPGFFMLVAILVLMVVSGSWMLKYFQVADPGSTSFLAVGLAVVIALLFLIEVIFEWWMVIVMPLTFVATFALSHWVTVRYIEPSDQQ